MFPKNLPTPPGLIPFSLLSALLCKGAGSRSAEDREWQEGGQINELEDGSGEETRKKELPEGTIMTVKSEHEAALFIKIIFHADHS